VNLSTVGVVFRKELLDFSRDRRAIFVMIVLPVLLYPLITVGFTYASFIQVRTLEKRIMTVWVRDLTAQPESFKARLKAETAHLAVLEEPPGEDEPVALSSGRVQAIVHPPSSLDAAVADLTTTTPIEIIYNGGIDASLETRRHLVQAIQAWKAEVVKHRLVARSLASGFIEPVAPVSVDLAPPGAILGRMLAFILIISSLMGAFYPAIDLGAGEKERGTLETLLLAPAQRIELAAGKFCAVFSIALASAVLNLGSLGVTFAHFSSLTGGGDLGERLGSVTVTVDVVVAMLIVLVPLVALFSALALAISTLATSYKEGTSYLQPLGVVTSLLSAASTLPGVELSSLVCLVPVAGAAILFKELLGGTAHVGHAILVVVSSGAYAAIAVRWVGTLYEREEVLVRPAAAAGLNLLKRAAPRIPGEPCVPALPQALAAGVIVLLLNWFLGQKLQAPGHTIEGLCVTLVLLVALPPILYARFLELDLRATFKLRAPSVLALAAAVLLALGGQILAADIASLQAHVTGEPLEQERVMFGQLLAELFGHGATFALVAFAFLPAVCEELLFRGFILSGLRRESGPVGAVLVSALLFGVNHLDPAKLGSTAALGVLLAVLVLRSRSIVPAMLCHFTNNGLALVLAARGASLTEQGWFVDGRPAAVTRGLAVACVALGLALLSRVRPDEGA
jgi:sodium transport system permease protein